MQARDGVVHFPADCVFANLGGGVTTSVALVNVQASFLRCDFRGNVAEVRQATVLSAGGTAAVRLDQCRFDGNAGAGQLALDWTAKPPMSMSGYFSDEGVAGSLKVAPGGGGGGGGRGPVCHCRAGAEAAMTLAEAPTVFLTPSDNWLTGVQEVRSPFQRDVGVAESDLEPKLTLSTLIRRLLVRADASVLYECQPPLPGGTGAVCGQCVRSSCDRNATLGHVSGVGVQ